MKNVLLSLSLLLSLSFLIGCGDDSNSTSGGDTGGVTSDSNSTHVQSDKAGTGEINYRVEEGMAYAYRTSKEFKDYNGKPKATPVLDYAMDLEGMDASELRILRATVQARKGEPFADDQLRQHFMSVEWYQPVWWDHDYRPSLDDDEKAFIARVEAKEKNLQANRIPQDADIVKTDRIANRYRMKTELMQKMDPVLAKNGLAMVPSKNEQMFHIYDQNNYQAIPSFITTDFYLQLMHVYFSRILQEVEKEFLIPVLTKLIDRHYQKNEEVANSETDPTRKAAAEYNLMFFGMAYELLTDKPKSIPASMQAAYKTEIANARAASGQGSQLLQSEFFDYSLFKPRGHYTRSPEQKRYFRAMMWLQIAPFYKENKVAFDAAMLASTLEDQEIKQLRRRLSSPIDFLVGEPNGAIFPDDDILAEVSQNAGNSDVFSEKFQQEMVFLLEQISRSGFKKGANEATDGELEKFAVYFLPQRYTFDAEVLFRLVDIRRQELKDEPKRPYPKGLDVMAVMGSGTARDILLNQYKETENWPAYNDTLKVVRKQLGGAAKSGKTTYNLWMNCLNTLLDDTQGPFEKKSRGWALKNLNTALGSWTELKHNTILYADQPMGAQMGDGGEEWPPAYLPAYVENNPQFWKQSLDLIRMLSRKLDEVQMSTENIRNKTKSILKMGEKLQSIASRQKSNSVTNDELDWLRGIGGEAEWLTLELMDKTVGWYELNETDRFMALAADVYTYQGSGPVPSGVLEETIGYADEMYVVVPWKDGSLQLMRGAVFSYYEFIQPIDDRLTDEEWQKMLKDGKAPKRPIWMDEVMVKE
jgi:hypothetical protein